MRDDKPYRTHRFIPAGAGNTVAGEVCVKLHSVYPRWRGEHISHAGIFSKNSGLSPLARGTPMPAPLDTLSKRFIPAGAGNTPVMLNHYGNELGLSPLARGTRIRSFFFSPARRFIPAGAGNTVHLVRGRSGAAVYPRWRGEHTKRI